MEGCKTTFSWDSELSADSVEFCRSAGHLDKVVIGTYFVEKSDEGQFSPSQRRGRIYLQRLHKSGLELLQSLDVDAVLDMKWSSHAALLAVADAKGNVSIYQLVELTTGTTNDVTADDDVKKASRLELKAKASIKDDDDDENLALSLDWNDRRSTSAGLRLVASGSKGNLVVFNITLEGGSSEVTVRMTKAGGDLTGHDFEAWIAAFDCWKPESVVYSGGDDMALKVHDLRTNSTVLTNRKHHTAGVTSLLSDAFNEHRIFSGSYDDTLATWDTRTLRQPVQTLPLGGGVWRIRQSVDHTKQDMLAVAAMYNGFHLVSIAENKGVLHYQEHDSIAYGIDLYQGTEEVTTLVSCSFYDHLVNVWSIDVHSLKS